MAVNEVLDILMFVAMCGFLLLGFPVAFTIAGTSLIFAGLGYMFGVFSPAFLSAMPQRIFGTMTNEVLIAVPLFIFMGVMLERSKVAEELLDSMGKLFGRMRGGIGISVSIVGALLAASTGIVGATVVTMGLLSLPTMLRRGYDKKLAAGSICAAGTLGQIIPPSIVLVLLGDVISAAYQKSQLEQGIFSPETVSVGDLFAGAMIPGLMLVGLYIGYQILTAILRPETSPPLPEEELRRDPHFWGNLLHALVPPIVLIICVLGSILGGLATPTESAAVGAMGAILLAGIRLDEKHGWPIYASGLCLVGMLVLSSTVDLRVTRDVIPTGDMIGILAAALMALGLGAGIFISLLRIFRAGILRQVCTSTLEVSTMVFVILIGAALFSLVFRGLGGDDTVHEFLTDMPGGVVGAMIIVMVMMFILGFFLDYIEITFVVVPIVAPVLLAMGVNPIWLGVIISMNLQTSFLTPPFGFALFYLRGVAPPEVKTTDIYRGVIPFVFIQIIAMGLLALFPGLTTWLPSVVFG